MSTKDKKLVSPIAIDLGAKNTGVYYAHYQAGTKLSAIKKEGEVLEWGKYTSLLKDRTANRHIRRNYQRRKLAKRLLYLILENYFQFPVKNHIQALGFFMNRRGFNRLEANYSEKLLNELPDGIWKLLPLKFKEKLDKGHLAESLENLANQKELKAIEDLKKSVEDKTKLIKKKTSYWKTLNQIDDAICNKLNGKEIIGNKKDKSFKISKWIIERAVQEGIKIEALIDEIQEPKKQEVDMLEFLKKNDDSKFLKDIQRSLPNNIEIKEQKKKLNNNEWNFDPWSFDLGKNEDCLGDPEYKDHVKLHLQHLCFAIYKIYDELSSGGRHRNSFFKEIKKDLENLGKSQITYLKDFGDAISNSPSLDIDKIFHLIAHISNLELKPLRVYFNDKTHLKSDQWDLKKISDIFKKWFSKQWRVSLSDGEKKKQEYKELKNLWTKHKKKDDVISFWIKACPSLTIPPYQDIKNRRPPRCQTLLLNQEYLDDKYSDWRKWIEQLIKYRENSFLKRYEDKLKELKSQKQKPQQKPLIKTNEIDLRKLQLLLDTSKALDAYKLNDIWSTYHQLHQIDRENNLGKKGLIKEYKEKINKSNLPEYFKKDLLLGIENLFEKESFGHFINKYYQTKRKARDGRYFLHQIKKNKWSDKDKLLKICIHKPRQKKYQLIYDLIAIFGIELDVFKNLIDWDDTVLIATNIKVLEKWLEIKLENFSKKCADAQKKYRGSLKYKIDIAIKQQKNGHLKHEDGELINLDKQAKKFSKEIAQKLWPDKSQKDQDQQAQRFESVFSFAQIYSVVFKDRNGFSKTCPVCSLDNSRRMEVLQDSFAYASRLSGLSIRLIDGAVMRICDRLGSYIVQKKWPIIKTALKQEQKVCIPLIMEQNHFAFEPTLNQIKGNKNSKKQDKQTDDRETNYNEKIGRIKKASKGICPYEGINLSNSMEIDHIIPQASKYGTLNDEANLIYASKLANSGKTDTQYSLSDIHKKYKIEIFGTDNNEEIKNYIHKSLLGDYNDREENLKNKTFIFGKYQNFIQLNEDQQKSFRHALFLKGDLTREMAINAISNRNRAIVNGTQRYFAQCIADKFYQKAKSIQKEKKISFDYFEYSSESNREKSIYELRNFYLESSQEGSDLKKNNKERGAKQTPYSHLLDAQMAFLLACDEHRDNGSMGVCFDFNEETSRQGIDIKTGEVLPLKYFCQTKIPEEDIQVISIDRKKSNNRPHRSYTRDSFYADHYLPLLIKKDSKRISIKVGFDWQNSIDLKINEILKNKNSKKKSINIKPILNCLKLAKSKDIAKFYINEDDELEENINRLYQLLENKYGKSKSFYYISWDKYKIHNYFIENFSNTKFVNRESNVWWDDTTQFFMNKLHYRTERKNILDNKENKKKNDLFPFFQGDKQCEIKTKIGKLKLPTLKDWKRLKTDWINCKKENISEELKSFIEKHLIFKNQKYYQHQKTRKVFSLPVVTKEGNTLQKRTSWNKEKIFQIWSDSESREDNNKFSRLVFNRFTEELKEVVNKPFISKKQFKLDLKSEKFILKQDSYQKFNPNHWYEIIVPENLRECIERLEYQIDNVTRPKIKLTPKKELSTKDINKIKSESLTKAKDNNEVKKLDKLKESSRSIEYTGSGFNKDVRVKLIEAIRNQNKSNCSVYKQ